MFARRWKNRVTITDQKLRQNILDEAWIRRMINGISRDQILRANASDGTTAFHEAFTKGTPAVAKLFMDRMQERLIEALVLADHEGRTALHLAAQHQDAATVLSVLRALGDYAKEIALQRNGNGATPLEIMAANDGSEDWSGQVTTEAIQECLTIMGPEAADIIAQPTVMSASGGQTPLHHVARNHDLSAIQAVVAVMGEERAKEICLMPISSGNTVLSHVAYNHRKKHGIESLRYLINLLGEQVEDVIGYCGENGWTPLFILSYNQNKTWGNDALELMLHACGECVQDLLALKTSTGHTSIMQIISNGFSTWNKATLRMVFDACGDRLTEIVSIAAEGWTNLHSLTLNYTEKWDGEALQMLLDAYGDRVPEIAATEISDRRNPLHNLITNNGGKWSNHDLEVLLAAFAERAPEIIAMQNSEGWTALNILAKNNSGTWNLDSMQLLLMACAERASEIAAIPTNGGWLPVDTLINSPTKKWDYLALFLVLQALGENAPKLLTKADEKGWTTFHVLARNETGVWGSEGILLMLASLGDKAALAMTMTIKENNWSVLHYVTRLYDVESVILMIYAAKEYLFFIQENQNSPSLTVTARQNTNNPKVSMLVMTEGIAKLTSNIGLKQQKEQQIAEMRAKLLGLDSQSTEMSSQAVSSLPVPPPREQTPRLGLQSAPAPAAVAAGDIQSSLMIPYDQLTMDRELGRGGYGVVYKATWRVESVAVKQYQGISLNERIRDELMHEVQVMEALRSRYLVRLYGVSEDNGTPMLVMEYLQNGSLFEWLQKGREMTWILRLRMADEMTRGLAYLHHEGILHRDMKSLNVLLDEDCHVKLADFGLAKLKSTSSSTATQGAGGSAVGTLRWMAPELFDRRPDYGQASDVWALGIVFWELLTGKYPFQEQPNDQIVINWISRGDKEDIPEECPDGYKALIERCWLDKTARPSADELITAVDALRASDEQAGQGESKEGGSLASAGTVSYFGNVGSLGSAVVGQASASSTVLGSGYAGNMDSAR